MKNVLGALLLAFFALSALATDEVRVPLLVGRVNDYANVLTAAEKSELETALSQYEKKTSNQIAVLTMPTIVSTDLFSFSQDVYTAWKLGQKGKDNGVLIVMIKDRLTQGKSTRIHTGRGVEGVLPDALCTRIVVEYMKPLLIHGKYYEGLQIGVARVIREIEGEPKPVNRQSPGISEGALGSITLALALIILVAGISGGLSFMIISGLREKRRRREAAEAQVRWDALSPRMRAANDGEFRMRRSNTPSARSPVAPPAPPPRKSDLGSIVAGGVIGSVASSGTPSFSSSPPSDSPSPPPSFSGGGGGSAGGGGSD